MKLLARLALPVFLLSLATTARAQSLTALTDAPKTIYGGFTSYHQNGNHIDGGIFFAKALNSTGTYSSSVLSATGGLANISCQLLAKNCAASTSFKTGVEQMLLQDGRFAVSCNGSGGVVTGGLATTIAYDYGCKGWIRLGAASDQETFIGIYPHFDSVAQSVSTNGASLVLSLIIGRGKK